MCGFVKKRRRGPGSGACSPRSLQTKGVVARTGGTGGGGGGERRCSDGGRGEESPALSTAHLWLLLSNARRCQKDPDGGILSANGQTLLTSGLLGNAW